MVSAILRAATRRCGPLTSDVECPEMQPTGSFEEAVRAAWGDAPGLDEHWETLAGQGVLGRARVADLGKVDARAAILFARKIEHPWYRCQALASIVEQSPSHPEAESLLLEALKAAYEQSEPNRVASVSPWPLMLLVKFNLELASTHTKKLLGIISQEPHGLRRLDGLSSILVAVVSVQALRDLALTQLLETAKVCAGWRTERIIDKVVEAVAPFDRDRAFHLLASRPVTRYTKGSRALLASLE